MKTSTSTGFILHHFTPNQVPPDDSEKLGAHRDDFYMFFLIEGGEASMMIDFNEIVLVESSVFYVLPGQIHSRFSPNSSATGWFLGVDASLIPLDYREVFDRSLLLQHPVLLPVQLRSESLTLLSLLHERGHKHGDDPFNLPVIHSLLQAFLGITTGCFMGMRGSGLSLSRPVQLSQQFKKLLVQSIVTVKSPSQYASLMNVSESYLNEVLKKTTGFAVSYWIQYQVMLEAKRLLYYTQLTVKEIAHQLGYEDSTYFLRIFKKFTGTTPLVFRIENRK